MESLFTFFLSFFREITMRYSTGHGKNTYKLTPNDKIFSSNRSLIKSESKKKFSLRYSIIIWHFFIILVSMAFFCDQLTGFLDFVTQTACQVLIWVFQFRVRFFKTGNIVWRQLCILMIFCLTSLISGVKNNQFMSDGINKKLRLNF